MVTKATTKEYRGRKVLGGKKGRRKIGKVLHTVFHPTKPLVVGFIVKRPDLFLMFKRKDRFIAFDAVELVDGRLRPTMGADSWDEKAIQRLDIDYDKCIIWENMPIRTEDGEEMGCAAAITFDDRTGKVTSVSAGDGATAKALLGTFDIPLDMIRGYQNGYLVFTEDAAGIEASGGLAAKAGARTAKAGAKMKDAGKKTEEVVNEGAYRFGGVLGKAKGAVVQSKELYAKQASLTEQTEAEEDSISFNLGKVVAKGKKAVGKPQAGGELDSPKSKGMFSAFKDEYDKARKGE